MEPSTPASEQPTASGPSQNPQVGATAAAPAPAATPAPAFTPITPAERAWLTFPPFPKPPPGVELIAFKDFKPLGIIIPEPVEGQEKREGEDAPVEVDGLGIQTLTLRVHHDLTTMEKRKRKNLKTKMLPDGRTVLKRWYDEWAEGENLRRTSCPIDPCVSRHRGFRPCSRRYEREGELVLMVHIGPSRAWIVCIRPRMTSRLDGQRARTRW